MSFLAPERLALLLVVAALVGAYLMVSRRRRGYAVRFTNLELLASLAPRHPAWRRHVPAAAALAALAFLVVGSARPTRAERVPQKTATVVLAVDVSVSMSATDVEPDRLTAAREAAADFTRELPARIRLGLVAFDGSARVLVAPTTDRRSVLTAIEGLYLGPGTATGEAVFASLATIGEAAAETPDDPAARIVLMSDGKLTMGRSAESAMDAAQEANVPVSTIAFGTDDGTVVISGELIPVPVDRDALEEMAEATGGAFFEAASGDELEEVYAGIGSTVGFEVVQREITAVFVTVAAALLALSTIGSLLWTSRLP
ncbi:MAG: VWA domain-containing protein [Acidimicrobiia bacterium]